MMEQFEATDQEALQSAFSVAISNFNGLAVLAGILARESLLQRSDLQLLHRELLRPLETQTGGHAELTALHIRRIDDVCAAVGVIVGEQD